MLLWLMAAVFLVIIDVTLTICTTLNIVQLCHPSDPSLISPSVSGCQPLVPWGVYAMVSTMCLYHLDPLCMLSQLILLVHVVSASTDWQPPSLCLTPRTRHRHRASL